MTATPSHPINGMSRNSLPLALLVIRLPMKLLAMAEPVTAHSRSPLLATMVLRRMNNVGAAAGSCAL